jgi:hypothetical protein
MLSRKHFGSLAHVRKETRRIQRIIERQFEIVQLDAWIFELPLSPDNAD